MKTIYLLPYEFKRETEYFPDGVWERKDLLNNNVHCRIWKNERENKYITSHFINGYSSFEEAAKNLDNFMITIDIINANKYEIIEEKDVERFKEKLKLLL